MIAWQTHVDNIPCVKPTAKLYKEFSTATFAANMSLFRKFLYVSTALLVLGSMYMGNFFLDDFISKEFSEFKARVQVSKLSTTVVRLSKDLMELKKKKKHVEVQKMRNKREESFRRALVDGKNLENNKPDSVHRVLKRCLKNSVAQNDPLIRTKAIIDDADTRKRKSVLKRIPHPLCPLSLDPKKDINEYLFFQDAAQKKHLKFQSEYLNKLNCARHRSTAQFSQDIRLHRNFFKFAKNLVFVEVGAFDGVVFSNTYFEVCDYTFYA